MGRWLRTIAGVSGCLLAAMLVQAAPVAAASPGATYVPLQAVSRIVDTRSGLGIAAPLKAGGDAAFQVAGKGGVPASGVGSVLLSVGGLNTTAATYLVVWPDGKSRPSTYRTLTVPDSSNLWNSTVVPLGSSGKVRVFNGAGTTDVVVDVEGYFPTSAASGQSRYVPVAHTKVLDTRSGLGAPANPIPAGGSLNFTITTGPIPAGATAVYASFNVAAAPSAGFMDIVPTGGSGRTVFDYTAGGTAMGAAARVGSGGHVTLTNHGSRAVDVAVVVEGYFSSAATDAAGMTQITARLLDTRPTAKLAANATVDVAVGGTNGLPTRGIAGAALQLTALNPASNGLLRAWPTGDPAAWGAAVADRPDATSRTTLVWVRPGSDGKVTIRNDSDGATDLLVDLEAWFAAPLPPVPIEQSARMSAVQATPVAGASVGTLEYGYVDNIGRLVHGHQTDPDNFSSLQWTVISGNEAFSGQPALAEQADGRLQVAGQNVDSDIWVNTQTTKSPPAWAPAFTNLGGSMAAPPALVRLGNGSLALFAVDVDGRLWFTRQAAPNGAYLSWRSLGDVDLTGTPTLVAINTGVQVFALDTSGALRTALFANDTLSAWTGVGGSGLTGSPAVVTYPGWSLRVFVRAADGTILTKKQDPAGAWPQTWDPVGALALAGSPTALLSPVTGRAELVARGTDGNLHSTGETQPGSGVWRDWIDVSLVDPSTGLPEVAATDPTAFTVTGATYTWAFVFLRNDGARRVYTIVESLGLAPGAAAVTGRTLDHR